MITPGTVSYSAAAVLFAALALLLILGRTSQVRGRVFMLAAVVSVVWAAAQAYVAYGRSFPVAGVFASEVFRDGLWLVFLLQLLGGERGHTVPASWRYGVHALWLVTLVAGTVIFTIGPTVTDPRAFAPWLIMGLFALSLVGLVLIEQLYRNVRPDRRWALKFLCLGLGAIFAMDVYLYAHGLLFRQIDPDIWAARGAVNAIAVPLLAVAAARNPVWSGEVFVSRQVVFYTTTLTAVGIYLLAMAVGGYYIRIYGGSWGTFAQLVFLLGAALVLLVILFSGQVRSWLRVFLAKHFFTYKYEYREEWLRLTNAMSETRDGIPLRERAMFALSGIMDSRGSGLWLKTNGSYGPVAGDLAGPAMPTELADSEFARFLNERQWIVDLDAQRGRPIDKVPVPSWLLQMEKAWLVVPLLHGGEMIGFVVLGYPHMPQTLGWEDYDVLRAAGRQVASYLAQEEAASALAESQQFQAFNRLSAFIMHDLKNLIAQQSLVVRNAARHKDNPEFVEDAIATIDNSVQRMTALLEQLRRGEGGASERTDLHKLCTDVVTRRAEVTPQPLLHCGDGPIEVRVEPTRMAMVLGHLIKNAQDATAGSGHVDVKLAVDDSQAVIEVEDTGTGMAAAFVRQRLFRPFDSTKGSKGMGIGAYQAREFIRSVGGDINVASQPGVGTTFTIRLPLAVREEAN